MSPPGINNLQLRVTAHRNQPNSAVGDKLLVKMIHTRHQLETLGHYSLMEFKGFKNRRGI